MLNRRYKKHHLNQQKRRPLLVLAVALVAIFTAAAGPHLFCCTLEIRVGPLEPASGTLRVALFNSADRFMKEPFRVQELKVEGPTLNIVFYNLPEGQYAFSLYHDVNNNGKLDTGLLGIPSEPWGFSNNARGRFGPPHFNAASFKLNKPLRMSVKLNR
ncbi:MAG: hypothetical protein KatS3mg032_1254 [Cyclobacteriaceae bacterium]|nr:MAG: hypothetical protein KatS3mg032_1254 [Cyclobacteriaceae bacterium]